MTQNLLEPWVLLRMVAGLVALLLCAAATARKVLRHFDVQRATEGQLALERQLELAATFVRVGAVVQVLALVLSVLGADRMSRAVRGAMCAYGVFGANAWGFRSLAATGLVALVAGVVAQVYAFDARVRSLDLARPLARLTLVMAPLAAVDLALAGEFLLRLDLTAVASCCSVQLDPVAAGGEALPTSGCSRRRSPSPSRRSPSAPRSSRVAVRRAGGSSSRPRPRWRPCPRRWRRACSRSRPTPSRSRSTCAPSACSVGTCSVSATRSTAQCFLAVTWAVGAGVSALLARGADGRAVLGGGRATDSRRARVGARDRPLRPPGRALRDRLRGRVALPGALRHANCSTCLPHLARVHERAPRRRMPTELPALPDVRDE